MQLFEIHDQAWFPGYLRDLTTDGLQFVLSAGNVYGPIVGLLAEALRGSGTDHVIDLCAGAGGPWAELTRELEQREGLSVDVCLTDKYPNERAVAPAKAPTGRIRFYPKSVDATHIPEALAGFRTIFSSFHHFGQREARAILQDAVAREQGIGIFEAADCRSVTIFLTILMPIGCLLLTPFIRPFRWSRLFWTYVLPVVPFVLWFDGVISCLRSYSLKQLGELSTGLAGQQYVWKIGRQRRWSSVTPVVYLVGYPVRGRTGAAS